MHGAPLIIYSGAGLAALGAADTNWVPAANAVVPPAVCKLRIMLSCASGTPKVRVTLTAPGVAAKTLKVLSDAALAAQIPQTFDVEVVPGWTFNVQTSTDVGLDVLIVKGISGETS